MCVGIEEGLDAVDKAKRHVSSYKVKDPQQSIVATGWPEDSDALQVEINAIETLSQLRRSVGTPWSP
jgi:hypothetical protein